LLLLFLTQFDHSATTQAEATETNKQTNKQTSKQIHPKTKQQNKRKQ